MQCDDLQAMIWDLYAQTHLLRPDTEFDAVALEDALDCFKVTSARRFLALPPGERIRLIKYAYRISPKRPLPCEHSAILTVDATVWSGAL